MRPRPPSSIKPSLLHGEARVALISTFALVGRRPLHYQRGADPGLVAAEQADNEETEDDAEEEALHQPGYWNLRRHSDRPPQRRATKYQRRDLFTALLVELKIHQRLLEGPAHKLLKTGVQALRARLPRDAEELADGAALPILVRNDEYR